MKKTVLTLLLSFVSLVVTAQNVWIEGSTWKVSYCVETGLEEHIYTLMSPVMLEGTEYLPLTQQINNEDYDTLAYIRCIKDDGPIYARMVYSGNLQPEFLLYDFSERFEPNVVVRFGSPYGEYADTIATDYQFKYVENAFGNEYLPIWGHIIYKIGSINGPLWFLIHDQVEGPTPKPTNVSHILFGNKKGYEVTIGDNNSSFVPFVETHSSASKLFNLDGILMPYAIPLGIYIKDGKKVIAK